MNRSTHRLARLLSGVFLVVSLGSLSACGYGSYRGIPSPGVELERPSFVTVSVPSSVDGHAGYDLLVGVTEVTQRQWRDVMGTEPSFARCENCPVEMVSWYDAAAYANALSEREGLTPCYTLSACTEARPYGRGDPGNRYSHQAGLACEAVTSIGPSCNGYRLPSRAEWEVYGGVAAVAESRRAADRYATFYSYRRRITRQVASHRPNEHGLYDTLGNVEEWLDVRAEAPARTAASRQRVALRVWFLAAGTCFRSTRGELYLRHYHSELGSWARDCAGFRLVRTAPVETAAEGGAG
ncbi:MAG: SUMF1/EgtB/PvdO family nonheme iron enzyme [Myxococcales bacterium]|nr:SUMF1/EgtB/PvdO family nonheme iron enzyme [Myxococcales bacterium]MCB9629119.1 SUMF1/EgtB/PvdO family nonheme iron enzyme [Sandaracinaceae bacterium]